MIMTDINDLSSRIIGAAIEVHRHLGPALLESAYQSALFYELTLQGISVRKEVMVPFVYKGQLMDNAFRADLIVDDRIIVELKATSEDNNVFRKQLMTYLKLTNKRLGLLINFNRPTLIEGVTRIINPYFH